MTTWELPKSKKDLAFEFKNYISGLIINNVKLKQENEELKTKLKQLEQDNEKMCNKTN